MNFGVPVLIKHGKVWGLTKPILVTPLVEVHEIEVNTGGHCSKHAHEHKHNMFYILEGTLEIKTWKNDYELVDSTILRAGESTTVKPGEYHQFFCINHVKALEIYYIDPINPNDIIRENVGGA